jgi:hypothetical protein
MRGRLAPQSLDDFLGIVLLRSASYVSAIIGCPHMKMPRGDGYLPPHARCHL